MLTPLRIVLQQDRLAMRRGVRRPLPGCSEFVDVGHAGDALCRDFRQEIMRIEPLARQGDEHLARLRRTRVRADSGDRQLTT